MTPLSLTGSRQAVVSLRNTWYKGLCTVAVPRLVRGLVPHEELTTTTNTKEKYCAHLSVRLVSSPRRRGELNL